jgi:hypothetical protein
MDPRAEKIEFVPSRGRGGPPRGAATLFDYVRKTIDHGRGGKRGGPPPHGGPSKRERTPSYSRGRGGGGGGGGLTTPRAKSRQREGSEGQGKTD